MSVHWPIIRRLLRNPLRVVAVDDRRSWRAADMLVGAAHLASEIERRSRTNTVAVLLPTCGAFPMAALAAWSVGKTIVPLNYLLSQEEVEWIVRHCGADLVIGHSMLEERLGWSVTNARTLQLDQMDFAGAPDLRFPARNASSDLACLLYTSGTSGRPKGVMLTHGNLRSNIEQVRKWVSLTPRDIVLGALPQFHSFGFTVLTLMPLAVGMKSVYTARFSPVKILELMREHRPTLFVGLPSMYNALGRAKSASAEDFESLRFLVSGGEPLPDAVFEMYRERFDVTLQEGYGLTETAPVTNWLRPEEFARYSVGKPLGGVVERIVDVETERDLGPGRDGEIRIAGPNIMAGYYRDPEQTAQVFDSKGFFRTGDMGRLDREGRLYITGRIKEMLIVGGENVFPREIEEVINMHPSVADSGVIGETDPSRGEVPVAFVELVEGATFDAADISDFCAQRLSRHKTPRRIEHVDALPRTATGKILRRKLRELLPAEAQ